MSEFPTTSLGPDRRVPIRAIGVYVLGMVTLTAAVSCCLLITDGGSLHDLLPLWLGFGVAGVALLLLPTAFWWWSPGRTTYVVAGGRLEISRGAKVIFDCPCSDIYGIWVRGGTSWPQLLNPKLEVADGKFPHLVVWTDEKFHAPPILRAGLSAARDLEIEIIGACRANGARSRLAGS